MRLSNAISLGILALALSIAAFAHADVLRQMNSMLNCSHWSVPTHGIAALFPLARTRQRPLTARGLQTKKICRFD